MKILKALIPVLAVATCAATSQPDERTIPSHFHGEWNSRLADCGTANNETMMDIKAGTVEFYESTGRVRGAFLDGPNDILIVLELTGEEETSTTAFRYSISPDGKRLTELSVSEEPFVRYRCS